MAVVAVPEQVIRMEAEVEAAVAPTVQAIQPPISQVVLEGLIQLLRMPV
jgi:hypothetical protein